MYATVKEISPADFPPALNEIPQPPKKLFVRGTLPDMSGKLIFLTVVGSRKHTSYGKAVCERIIGGLAGYPIVIVSGLALGIDAVAHRAAIQSGLPTIAVPGSGLDDRVLYPKSNLALAHKILSSGGTLLSEFPPEFRATPWSFPQRNRIMAGISQGVLVIEAEDKSGTLITARMATDYNRNVYAVPGSIFSAASSGTNALIRQGAEPITDSGELLDALGLAQQSAQHNTINLSQFSPEEQLVLKALYDRPLGKDELIRLLDMPSMRANIILSGMELAGVITEHAGKFFITGTRQNRS